MLSSRRPIVPQPREILPALNPTGSRLIVVIRERPDVEVGEEFIGIVARTFRMHPASGQGVEFTAYLFGLHDCLAASEHRAVDFGDLVEVGPERGHGDCGCYGGDEEDGC